MAGTGKTSVLAELQKYGFVVIDLDATGLCRWKNKETEEFTEYGLQGKDYDWLQHHGWYCDVEKLKILLSCIREDKNVFVGGIVENLYDVSQVFDKKFLLSVDKSILKERLLTRTNNHFGKKQDEQQFIIESSAKISEKLLNFVEISSNDSSQKTTKNILKELNL